MQTYLRLLAKVEQLSLGVEKLAHVSKRALSGDGSGDGGDGECSECAEAGGLRRARERAKASNIEKTMELIGDLLGHIEPHLGGGGQNEILEEYMKR